MTRLIFVFAFLVPIVIMFVGLYTGNNDVVSSGFSLFFFVFLAFVGNSIKEIKQIKVDKSILKAITPLFVLSIGALVYGIYVDKILIGGVSAFVMGVLAFLLLYKSVPAKKES